MKYRSDTSMTTSRQLLAVAVLSVLTVACSKSIKPEVHEPTKLVAIAQPQQVLQPLLLADVGSKGTSSKDPLDLQVVNTGEYILAASRGGQVSALTLGGKRAWSVDVKEPITGGVAYDALTQTAVISTRSGKVMALDASNGAVRWQQSLSGSVLTPALIHNNRVILSGNDGILHGLSLQGGQSVWQFATQVPSISIRGTAKPVLLNDETALLATADGRIHAITVDTGLPQWSRRVGVAMGSSEIERMTDVDAAPVIDGQQLYAISYSGQLLGVDLVSRQVMFVQDVASLKSVAVDDRQVVASTLDGRVISFDRNTGDILWQNDALRYRQLTNPVFINGRIAVGDLEGIVHVLDSRSGEIVSRVQSKGALSSLQVDNSNTRSSQLISQSQSGQVAIWQSY